MKKGLRKALAMALALGMLAAMHGSPAAAEMYEYEQDIHADGSNNFYLGSGIGYHENAAGSDIVPPDRNGVSAVVGEAIPGYGKEDGDQIYRFSDKIVGGWYQFLGWCHGSPIDGRDQVGEISYRLGANQSLMVTTNRWDDSGGTKEVNISRTDNRWHRLTYAYNSKTMITTIWVDGILQTTMTKASAGLWLISTAAINAEDFVEFDDLKAWTLKPESSGKTSTGADGEVVYDSYNYLVSEKLDTVTFPALSGGDFIISDADGIIRVDNAPVCSDIIDEVEAVEGITSAKVLSADCAEELTANADPVGGVLAVTKQSKSGTEVIKYYEIYSNERIYKYLTDIHADGSGSFYLGTENAQDSGPNSFVIPPDRNGASVTVGEGVLGFGKQAGDQIYRYTADRIPDAWYQLIGWSQGSPADSKDQAGEISYRLGTNQALKVTTNYLDANNQRSDLDIYRTDANWHKLSYAYNSVTHVTTIWVDGFLYGTMNTASAGLWLVSTAAISAGEYIELDDLKVWTLDKGSSGYTSTDDNGEIVYDSYNKIVADKLDMTRPAPSIANENMRLAGSTLALAADFTVGDIASLGTDGSLAVYASDFSAVTDTNAAAEDGMILFVQEGDNFAAYTIEAFLKEDQIWHKGLYQQDGQYKMKILNTSPDEISVVGIVKNETSRQVTEWNRVVFEPGELKEMGLGYTQADDMCFYLWNSALQPLCSAQYDR